MTTKQTARGRYATRTRRTSTSSTPAVKTAHAALERNRQKGRDALALVRRKVEVITEAFYDIALALQQLQRREIYSALGARSFAQLVETQTPISRSFAFELVKIPAHFSREAALGLGREKASALIGFVEATPASDSAEVLAREDARVKGKRISAQSARAIAGAAKKLRDAAGGIVDTEEVAARSCAHAVEERLERAAKRRGVTAPVVIPVRHRDGWWLRVEVPLALGSELDARTK